MKPIKPCTLRRIREAREALERGEPLSMAEIAAHECACAEEMARAEHRRRDEPQLELRQ